jgi:thioredoxin 1
VAFLAEDFEGRLLVTALDVDENPQTTERYAVMGMPTLLFLHKESELHRQVGLRPYEELKQIVEDLLAEAVSV